MAGFQNSNKLYTESSNTSALTTAVNTHYSQQALTHPTTPTSPAPSLPNSSASTNGNSNIAPNSNSSAKNNITSAPRSLNTAPVLQHSNNSAFSPYQNNIPQHPTPVTTPTSTKPQLVHPDSTMMASHLDSNALIYPQHSAHFNPPNQFWPSWNTLSGGNSPGAVAISNTPGGSAFMPAVGYGATPGSMSQHNPRPKLTTTIWEDEGTLCYQVDARGICVARRQGMRLLFVIWLDHVPMMQFCASFI